jgi:hypothetical protein
MSLALNPRLLRIRPVLQKVAEVLERECRF